MNADPAPRATLARLAAAGGTGHVFPDDIDRADRDRARLVAGPFARTVSVIIPTRDRQHVVGAAIDTALSQSLPPLEIVVIDDGSRDDTDRSLRRSFAGPIERGELVMRTTTGLGQGGARNLGLATARGRHIAYLDSDNTWHTDHLLWMLAAGIAPGDADLAYAAVHVHQHDTGRRHVVSQQFDLAELFHHNYIDTSAMVHGAEHPRRWGGWDLAMSRAIDWDFALRMVSERDGVHVPVVTVHMNLAASLGNVTIVETVEPDIARLDAKYPVQRTAVGAARFTLDHFRERCRHEHAPAPAASAPGPAAWAGLLASVSGPVPHSVTDLPEWSDASGLPTCRRRGERPVLLIVGVHADVGGAERLAIELIRQWRDRFEVVYLVTAPAVAAETLHGAIEAAGATVIDVSDRADPDDLLPALWAVRVAVGADLVLLTNSTPWIAAHGADLRMLFADVPIVAQHYYDEQAGWIATHVASGADLYDHFIAINHGIHARLTGEFGVPGDRVSLVHHAIDLDRVERGRSASRPETRARFGIGPDRFVVAQVGRLVDQKQPLVFLELARRWRHRPEYLFVLVGDGPLRSECDAAIGRGGLDNVVMIPFVDEVPAFLHACDLLTLCSRYEGLPLVALEALAVGTPVLTTPVGDLPWCLDRFGGGETLGGHDPITVLDADLDAFRRRWCRPGVDVPTHREAFVRTFGGAAVADRYAEVLGAALDRRQRWDT